MNILKFGRYFAIVGGLALGMARHPPCAGSVSLAAMPRQPVFSYEDGRWIPGDRPFPGAVGRCSSCSTRPTPRMTASTSSTRARSDQRRSDSRQSCGWAILRGRALPRSRRSLDPPRLHARRSQFAARRGEQSLLRRRRTALPRQAAGETGPSRRQRPRPRKPMKFHSGEVAVQERAGVRDIAEDVGEGIVDHLPPGAIGFLELRQMAVLGTVDSDGACGLPSSRGSPGLSRR